MRLGDTDTILVFAVDTLQHALPVWSVEKVELAAEVTPLPEAPRAVIGTIDWRGRVLPVLSMRRRLHLPDRGVGTSDRIIVVQSSRRCIALMVDEILGVRPWERSRFTAADAIFEGLGCVAGAMRTEDGIVLIHDVDLFLSEEDGKALEKL